MEHWTHCKRAREDADKINAMIAETHGDRELEFSNLHEAMVCAIYDMMLCKHEMKTADHEQWKDYNREMYDAVYPEDSHTVSSYTADSHSMALTSDEAHEWVNHMDMPENGSGAHWTMAQTTAEAKKAGITFDKFTECDFWVTMNMMFSDYYKPGRDVGTYVDLARKFLCDADGYSGTEKLYRYWKYVAKH